ncbi:LacI family DNA-binding transcriptional regulator [Phycisphaerales bacterium AB-hyl4]|uniref:LacI family DNA-binding transcriptional regulator n=1 Tax=Natronomicrosphaera hydrolytica TaxID=3242702 RepID=A0ABV4U7Q6_9BACT
MATLADIAQQAKVSPSTVSLAINNRKGVKPETRRRIKQLASELGYRFRQLDGENGSSDAIPAATIGVVYPASSLRRDGTLSDLQAKYLFSIRKQLKAQKSPVSVLAAMDHVEQDPFFRQMIDDDSIAGLIFLKATPSDGYTEYAAKNNIPQVVLGSSPAIKGCSSISVDHYDAGRQVAEFFASRGHKQVAMVDDQDSVSISLQQRAEGFAEACAEYGLELTIKETGVGGAGGTDEVDGQSIVEAVRKTKTTAVFCVTDAVARNTIAILEPAGLRVPGDVAVVGFDNVSSVVSSGNRITSVGYDIEKMASFAPCVLAQMMEKKLPIREIKVTIESYIAEHHTT